MSEEEKPKLTREILTPDNVQASEVARRFGGITAKLPQELNPGLVMGIVAPPNEGKTTLLGTLRDSPEHGVPAIIIDANANAHVIAPGNDIFIVKSKPGFGTAKSVVAEIKNGQHEDIKSLCFDHTTSMYHNQVIENKPKHKDARQAYGEAMDDLLNLTRDCLDLAEGPRRLNIFFIFQETQEKRIHVSDGRIDDIIRQEISLSDKMQTSWPNLVPLLAGLRIGMYVDPFPRVLDFTPSVNTMTKWQVSYSDTRLAALPIVVWRPSLGKLLDVLVGGAPVPDEWHDRPKGNFKVTKE